MTLEVAPSYLCLDWLVYTQCDSITFAQLTFYSHERGGGIISMMDAFLFSLIFLLLYFLTKKILRHGRRPVPPSPPFSLPILGHLHLLKKPLHRAFAKISDRHGPIVSLRFGSRPVILVSSPSIAEECFTKNDVIFANRPRFLAGKYLGYNYTILGWAPYGDHWRNLRRIVTLEILSSHRLQKLHDIRTDEVRSMVLGLFQGQKMEGEYQEVEMKTVFFELLLNVMMRMIAGKRYCGTNSKEKEEASGFIEILQESFRLSGATNLVDFIPLLGWMGLSRGMERRMMELQEKRMRLMKNLMGERKRAKKKTSEESRTMMDVLLSLQETEPESYPDEIISGLVLNMISAGTDTSASTMEWALSLLLNNPESLLKAQAEIDAQTGSSRLIDEPDLSQLPYLEAILNETLRMCPVAPLLVPHEASQHCTVAGYSVPRGTILMVNLWAIQNDPKYWTEPEKFKPERFLQLEGEGERERFRFVPFGAGRRRCPGEGLAMRMVGLAIGLVIQCFDWRRVREEMVDMREGEGLTMPKLRPLVVEYRTRAEVLPLLSRLRNNQNQGK